MRWEYYDSGYRSDDVEASLYNGKHKILDVVSGRTEHYTIPEVSFISSFSISYHEESALAKKDILPTDSTDEVLRKRLIAGCKEIEKNYLKQVEEIRGIIG